MAGRKKGYLFVNMTSYAALQIVNMIVGLFLPRLYLAVYGSEINGIISTANSFNSYFSYLEAGIGLTLIHSLFKPLAECNFNSINGILSYAKKQYKKISFVYFVLVVALSLLFPVMVKSDALNRIEFSALVLVIGLYGAFDFFAMAKYRVLLTADRKEYVISNAMILAQLLRFVSVWALLQLDISVVFVKVVPIFTLLVRSFILHIYIKRKYPDVDYSVASKADISIKSSRWDALLLQISINTSVSLPAILISQFAGFKDANVFAVYSLVASSMISIVSALSSGVAPKLGQNIARGETIKNLYRFYDYLVSVAIAILFSVMAIMSIPFVKLYTNVVNDVNYIYPEYAVMMAVWAAVYSYRIPLTAVINAAGVYKENRANNIINMCIQIVGGVFAAGFFGIPGVIAVMILASVQRNIGFAISISKKILHNGIRHCIIHQLIIVLSVCLSFYVAFPIINQIEYSVYTWVAVAIVVTIIEAILMLSVFILTDFYCAKQIYKRLKAMLVSKRV